MSQTGWLTQCCLLDLIDTLAVGSVNPRLVDVVVDFDLGVEESISDTVVTLTWQVLDNGFWRIIWLLLRLLINSSFLGWYFGWSIPPSPQFCCAFGNVDFQFQAAGVVAQAQRVHRWSSSNKYIVGNLENGLLVFRPTYIVFPIRTITVGDK